MAERNYWLDLFAPKTWDEFIKAGSSVSGFRESRWGFVQRIQKGDYLLCYLTGVGRWVGILDRNRTHNGTRFSDLPKMKESLPLQFEEATNRTIELIDVLWLKGNAIVAAFEIESTTSIYSGLLRMADLLAMQPNINIPLYLVAPDERRDKVMEEVNRPTFRRLDPPLAEVCSYISFQSLHEGIERAHGLIKYLKPDFLEELSEDCMLVD